MTQKINMVTKVVASKELEEELKRERAKADASARELSEQEKMQKLLKELNDK